jgi:hypothetical protein
MMANTTIPGRVVEKPHKSMIEVAEPNAEMKITFVTVVRSQRAERRTTPGTDAVLRRDTVSDPVMPENPIVRV